MRWASYNITSNSRGIAKLGKPWTQATAATLAPRVLQELRAMAAVADKDESTKEAISPEAWWVNCAPQEEQIWQTIYTSMGIWGFGIVGLHASFSGIFLKMFKSHDSEANDILSLRRSDHFMSVAHVSTYLRINVEAARMPGMIKKKQWLPCCVNLGEKSGASSCCSGPPLAAKLGPQENTLWHLLQNFHALDVSCFWQLIQLFHIIPHNLRFANTSIRFGVHACLSTDSGASAPRVSPVRPCGIVGAWDGGFWQSRLLLFWVIT